MAMLVQLDLADPKIISGGFFPHLTQDDDICVSKMGTINVLFFGRWRYIIVYCEVTRKHRWNNRIIAVRWSAFNTANVFYVYSLSHTNWMHLHKNCVLWKVSLCKKIRNIYFMLSLWAFSLFINPPVSEDKRVIVTNMCLQAVTMTGSIWLESSEDRKTRSQTC